jgi:hypothetical protein
MGGSFIGFGQMRRFESPRRLAVEPALLMYVCTYNFSPNPRERKNARQGSGGEGNTLRGPFLSRRFERLWDQQLELQVQLAAKSVYA